MSRDQLVLVFPLCRNEWVPIRVQTHHVRQNRHPKMSNDLVRSPGHLLIVLWGWLCFSLRVASRLGLWGWDDEGVLPLQAVRQSANVENRNCAPQEVQSASLISTIQHMGRYLHISNTRHSIEVESTKRPGNSER
eukprot:c15612_g1_i2.p2 GENE.c15612_g1_i2~~c15612_g1_i2.p2  ORF type:complete len:135 (-),score=15.07 c15612_g1_i2:520-924(-)